MELAYGVEVVIAGEVCIVVGVLKETGEISVLDHNMNYCWKLISQIEKIIG